jgi:hypothetical protein
MGIKAEQNKLHKMVSNIQSGSMSEAHYEFAVRGQLIRWFHERNTKELKAMQKGFLAVQAAKGGKK